MSKLIVGQWRVSMAVIETFGDLGPLFGQDAFKKNIEIHFMKYLQNTAAAVRRMGVVKSGQLAETFRSTWIITDYIPAVNKAYKFEKTGYNYRICCL